MRKSFLRVPAVALFGLLHHAAALSSEESKIETVGQWHRFEGMLDARRTYADPFRDVTLETEFIRPNGTRVFFWGFYNGADEWRFRMMADEVGTWIYRARFSDGSVATEGRFQVVPSERPGMIEVHSENPIWFGRRGGDAHLVRALHVGDRFSAANWPEADRLRFLAWARDRGYNMLSVASHYLNRRSEERGIGWETPDLWPLAPAAYTRMETILDLCGQHGIDVYPFSGFFGKDSNAPTDPGDQELYVRYTLARLGAFSNIVLNVAGPEPNYGRRVYWESHTVDRLGRLISRLDPFRHPLSVHNETGDDEYKHAPWTTFGTIQGPKTLDRVELGRGLRKSHHWAKPLFAQETLWIGNRNHPEYTMDDLRKNAWVLMLSAANFCFADNRGNSSTGFSGSMNPAEANEEAHAIVRAVWDAFEKLPFGALTPDYDVTEVGWSLSDRRNVFVIYIDSPVSLQPQLPADSLFSGRWIDAQTGVSRAIGREVRSGEKLQPPEGGVDWLLTLKRNHRKSR